MPLTSVACTYRMLAYRAENIYTRLEPQELYERGEMEEGVQFEVLWLSIYAHTVRQCLMDQYNYMVSTAAHTEMLVCIVVGLVIYC